jgi:ribonuclease-3
MRDQLEALQRRLDYHFNDRELLNLAMTHRSYRGQNNERLEFLGDAVLSTIIAEALYRQFPAAKEGQMSRMRASLVKGDTIADMARALNLGECLNLGSGELKSGGHRRSSILADAFESLIGAIYLDSGFARCQEIVLGWYRERLEALGREGSGKDSKTRLQEWLQARKLALPTYPLLQVSGEAHAQTFLVCCQVESLQLACEASGSSRREAEQEAARKVLSVIEQQ